MKRTSPRPLFSLYRQTVSVALGLACFACNTVGGSVPALPGSVGSGGDTSGTAGTASAGNAASAMVTSMAGSGGGVPAGAGMGGSTIAGMGGRGGSGPIGMPGGGSAQGGDQSEGTSGRGSGGAGGEPAVTVEPMGCPTACGPTIDQFFDDKKLATLRIEIGGDALEGTAPESWLDLLWDKWSHCAPYEWVSTTVSYESPDGAGNVTMENVGMRLRGSWQRGTNSTQGFKLDLQVLETPGPEGKRRFADLNRINVLSVERDPSHMLPCLAQKAMREFGLPAPRCNHLMVYVNGAYYGVMENIEQVNKGFVRRHFGTNEGSLYAASPSEKDCEPSFEDSKARLQYSSDTFDGYADQYRLDGATATLAEANLIPMLKCGDAAQTPDDAAFRTCISEWVNVDEWLKQIAAESIIPTLESWIGYYRNFYLYFTPDDAAPRAGRFSVWSWDLDSSFNGQRCSPSNCDVFTGVSALYGPRNQRAPLVQRLTTVFHTEYCAAMREFLDTVYDPSLVDEMASVMEPGLEGEPTVSAAEWQTAVDGIRAHIVSRSAEARSLVDAACE